jgi:hypothetical protein
VARQKSAIEVDGLLETVRALGKVADSKEVNRAFRELNKQATGIIADDAAPRAPSGSFGSLRNRSVYSLGSDRVIAELTVGGKNPAKKRGSKGKVGMYSGIVHYGTGRGLLGRKRPWVFQSFERKYDDIAGHYEKEITAIMRRFIPSAK